MLGEGLDKKKLAAALDKKCLELR